MNTVAMHLGKLKELCVRCFYTKVEDKWEMYLFCGCEMIYIYKCCVCLRMSGIDEVEF